MASKRNRRIWIWLIASIVVVGTVVALNRQWFGFAVAVAFAERRPALLADAEWDEPSSARRFYSRFPPGTSEAELLSWLEANDFTVDHGTGEATRLIRGAACNESIDVTWSRASGNVIGSVQARVSEAGCL